MVTTKNEKYRKETWTGGALLDSGIVYDAFQNPIIVTDEYTVRMYDKSKTMEILNDEDWHMLNFYETGMEIKSQGGLINWANYGERLGFFKTPADCIIYIEGMIQCFNSREDFEKSAYMFKELNALKKHMDENRKLYPEL